MRFHVKNIEPREYQLNILKTCKDKNTLVVLPTGTGKTIIAILLSIERLNTYEESKVLFLAPTKPLANQHLESFKKFTDIPVTDLVLVTGEVRPEKREKIYKFAKVIFATPQTVHNDLLSGRLNLEEYSLVIFDEAHRAVGKYPYVFIAKTYLSQSKYPRILALTASPGYRLSRIKEVIDNLGIEAIEIRSGMERDVKNYIKPIFIDWIEVEPDENFKEIQKLLKDALDIRYRDLKELGYITHKLKGKGEILNAIKELQKELSKDPKNLNIIRSLSLLAEILKLDHALEVFETQTYKVFVEYIDSLFSSEKNKRSKALKNVINDPRVRKAYVLAKQLIKIEKEHPKIPKLLEIIKYKLKNNPNAKILVFAQIKKTVNQLNELIKKQGISSEIFVGKSGMSRDKQHIILYNFREGKYNVLVCTSVGEEGIDIPKVDTVIFYEPIPSEIRYIQRRGRTGRGEMGEVKVLITKGTRDEAYMWSAIQREKKMRKVLYYLRKKLKITSSENKREEHLKLLPYLKNTHTNDRKEESLVKYVMDEKEYKERNINVRRIIADYREKDSGVIAILVKNKIFVELKQLEVGDYIVGNIIVERKTKTDFVNSILDGRIWKQIENLKKQRNSMLIIEGKESIYSIRNISPNLIRSVLLRITLDYGIPIIFTEDYIDTAYFLISLFDRSNESKIPIITKWNYEDPRINILVSFPGIGERLAKKLLEHFGSLSRIFSAPLSELSKIIGEERARRFKKLLEKGNED